MPGPALKIHEDRLDAIVCGYLAFYFWYWRDDRNEVFGDVNTGYIVNPRLVVGGIGTQAAKHGLQPTVAGVRIGCRC